MNTKYLAAVAALAVMLVAATALATSDNAFADKKRHDDKKKFSEDNTQSSASANDCGPRGGTSINTFSTNCLNDPDQIQDSDGAAVVSNPSQHSDAEN
jgi:hypothetical protein